MVTIPEVSDVHRELVRRMTRKAERGWYTGDMKSLRRYAAFAEPPGALNPELTIKLQLSKDRMHHSVGWWRNAEYEYCWHLSISAWESEGKAPVPIPAEEERYWTHAFFPVHFNKVWHEPGGTDPRLTPEEKLRNRHIIHQRVFLDPESFEPFVPQGEVYDLTRWIPGLTPDKVDR